MKNLESIHIEKSFKYIRKIPDGKGGWKYIYEEPEGTNKKQGGFGEIWGDYSGRPKEAFKKLFKERSGQCHNVFEMKFPVVQYDDKRKRIFVAKNENTGNNIYSNTSIDIVWGDKDKEVGLEHIVDDHYVKHNDFNSIKELQETIINEFKTIELSLKGIKPHIKDGRIKFSLTTKSGNRFIFAVQYKTQKDGKMLFRHFILTSYDYNRSESEKSNSPEEVIRRQQIFDSYGKEKPKYHFGFRFSADTCLEFPFSYFGMLVGRPVKMVEALKFYYPLTF